MYFSFTDEQEEFRSVLRRFLTEKSSPIEVRRLMETDEGYDKVVWQQLSKELGLTALAIPEEFGGSGFGVTELAIANEEMGRALLCAPYFSSAVLATTAILRAATKEQKTRWLPGLASGDSIATFAYAEQGGNWSDAEVATTAEPAADGYKVTGTKCFVTDGGVANQIIVVARKPGTVDSDGLMLLAVDAGAQGVACSQMPAMDPTRKLSTITFDAAQGELLGTDDAGAALAETLQVAAVCLAHEMAGGAERLLESAVDYAKLRFQFGRPIGSFQSLKHKLADMLMDVELTKSGAYYAAAAVDEGDPEAPVTAALIKAFASDVYMQTAVHTVQIHGGIGFTWENDTHLWFKRAKSSEVFLGTAASHREQMMRAMQV